MKRHLSEWAHTNSRMLLSVKWACLKPVFYRLFYNAFPRTRELTTSDVTTSITESYMYRSHANSRASRDWKASHRNAYAYYIPDTHTLNLPRAFSKGLAVLRLRSTNSNSSKNELKSKWNELRKTIMTSLCHVCY